MGHSAASGTAAPLLVLRRLAQAHLEHGSSHPRRTELTRDQSSQTRVSLGGGSQKLLPHNHKGRIAVAGGGPDQSIPYPKNKNGLDGERERTGRQRDGPPSNTTKTSCFGTLWGKWSWLCNCPVWAESPPAAESQLPKVATSAEQNC